MAESQGFFEIARVSKDVGFDEFYQSYFEPEKPVIIEGVGRHWLAKTKWSADYLREALSKEPSAESQVVYYMMRTNALGSDYEVPGLVNDLLDRGCTFPPEKGTRIWLNSKNNVSHWHYDSNIECVFNAQVKGFKEWTLVSPRTPLACYPFSNFAIVEDHRKSLRDKHYTTFVLNQGDMLYVPPLWFHRVKGLDEENINLNWVFTKRKTRVSSKTLAREIERYLLDEYFKNHEIAAVRRAYIRINSNIPGYLRLRWRFEALMETNLVHPRHYVIVRVLRELGMLGRTLLSTRGLRHTLRTIEKVPPLRAGSSLN